MKHLLNNKRHTPDALTPPAWRARGNGAGGIHKKALARLHSAGSLNRSHCCAAEGGGSSSAPTGRASFVEGPASVTLWDYSDETDRIVHAIVIPAGLPEIPILESPVSLDDALIQMQRCFEQDTGVDEVVDILSTVKIEDLAELKDTGVSKEVVIRARVTGGKKGDANVQGLMLKPLRTFPEIEIEPSAFSFRWQRVGEKDVKARLIERQHHLWRYDQCQAIAAHIKDLLPGIAVLV